VYASRHAFGTLQSTAYSLPSASFLTRILNFTPFTSSQKIVADVLRITFAGVKPV
jgi:hypothetical protein